MHEGQSFVPSTPAEQALRLIDADRAGLVGRIRAPRWFYPSVMLNMAYLEIGTWLEVWLFCARQAFSPAWCAALLAWMGVGLVWLASSWSAMIRRCRGVRGDRRLRYGGGRIWLAAALCLLSALAGDAIVIAGAWNAVPLSWLLPVIAVSGGGYAYGLRRIESRRLRLLAERNLPCER